jgi:hypothetical protein
MALGTMGKREGARGSSWGTPALASKTSLEHMQKGEPSLHLFDTPSSPAQVPAPSPSMAGFTPRKGADPGRMHRGTLVLGDAEGFCVYVGCRKVAGSWPFFLEARIRSVVNCGVAHGLKNHFEGEGGSRVVTSLHT